MKTDILINGHITLVLTPENDMEKEILKSLCKQENEIIDLRSTVHVLGKTLRDGIIITGKGSKTAKDIPPDTQDNTASSEHATDESKA